MPLFLIRESGGSLGIREGTGLSVWDLRLCFGSLQSILREHDKKHPNKMPIGDAPSQALKLKSQEPCEEDMVIMLRLSSQVAAQGASTQPVLANLVRMRLKNISKRRQR